MKIIALLVIGILLLAAADSVRAMPITTTANVTGILFNDCDCDGLQDNDELGLEGRSLILASAKPGEADQVLEAITASDGSFIFTGVSFGNFSHALLSEQEFTCEGDTASILFDDPVMGPAEFDIRMPVFNLELCRGVGLCKGLPDGSVVGFTSCGEAECTNTVDVVCEFGKAVAAPCEGLSDTPCHHEREECVVNEEFGILCPDKCFQHDTCWKGVCEVGPPVQCDVPEHPCTARTCESSSGDCNFELSDTCLEEQLGATLTSVTRDCLRLQTTFCYDVRHYLAVGYDDATSYLFCAPPSFEMTVNGRADSCREPTEAAFDPEFGISGVQWPGCESLDPQGELDGRLVEEWEFCVVLDGIVGTAPDSKLLMNHEGELDEVQVAGPFSCGSLTIDYVDVCDSTAVVAFQVQVGFADGAELVKLIAEVYSLARESIQHEQTLLPSDHVTTVSVRFFDDPGPFAARFRTAADIAAAFSLSLGSAVWEGTLLETAALLMVDVNDVDLLAPDVLAPGAGPEEEPENPGVDVVAGPEQLGPVATPIPPPPPFPSQDTITLPLSSSDAPVLLSSAVMLAFMWCMLW